MQSVPLAVQTRSAIRRTAVKKVRAEGKIPAVIYGKVAEPQALAVDSRTFTDVLHHHASEHILIDLTVEGDARDKRLALLKDVQHHPLSREVLHIDFHEISEDAPVVMTIPVESTGEAIGVKVGGGLLEHVMQQIKVRGLVKDIPEVYKVDVTNLEAGVTLHLGELPTLEGVEFLGNASNPVFTCTGKRGPSKADTPGEEAGEKTEEKAK